MSAFSAVFFSLKRCVLAIWRLSLNGDLCFLFPGFRLTRNGGWSPSTLLARNSLFIDNEIFFRLCAIEKALWELLNGGRVFESLSSRIFTFMDKQDIPVPNVIPRFLLDVIARLESDELRFTWTISRNNDGFSFSAKQVNVPANWDPRDPAKTSDVDVETKPRKARKKSPSQRAHDRARRKRYRKKKAALKAACFSPM